MNARIQKAGAVPGHIQSLARGHDQIADLFNRGIAVDSPTIRVERLPNGQVRLHLKSAPPEFSSSPSPPPANISGAVCVEPDSFWAEYDRAPGDGNSFHHYCLRYLTFHFDQDTLAVTEYRVFKTSDLTDEEISFWFTPGGTEIAALLAAVFGSPPPAGPLLITMTVEWYREVTLNLTPPPRRVTVGDITTSVPLVRKICYRSML